MTLEAIWERTKEGLAERHRYMRDDGSAVRFVIVFEGVRVGTRIQRSHGRLFVIAELAHLSALDAEQALRWNALLADQSLAISDGIYVVRSVANENIDLDSLEQQIQATARVASLIKRDTVVAAIKPLDFAYCAD